MFKINGREIGEKNPPYIIAELSANHNGSIEKAKKITADTVQNLSPRDVRSLLALLDKIEISK